MMQSSAVSFFPIVRLLVLLGAVVGAACSGGRAYVAQDGGMGSGGQSGGAGGGARGTGGAAGNGVGGAAAGGHGGGTGAVGGNRGGGAGGGGGGGGAKAGLGTSCAAATECASGFCADGVCCNSACTGSCYQCSASGSPGQCTAVAAGQPSPSTRQGCQSAAASSCQQSGLCDGKGGCQLYASGTACAAGSCDTTTQMSVTGSSCDGLGACKAAPPIGCAPFKCAATGNQCATICASDSDCQGQPCVSGSCGKVGNGSKCASAGQCTSGQCVDGYCCDVACTGSCQACDLTGTLGHCTALAAGQSPRGGRAVCASGTCGSACDGTSAACVFAATSIACGAASCTDGSVTGARSCDGKGTCTAAVMSACGGYGCSGASCRTTCTADNQCASATPYCVASACVAKKPLGTTCGGGTECASGNCVDGVCCSSSKCGTCMACNLTTPGTCTNKASGAADAACGLTIAACQTSTCNGSGACQAASDGTGCGVNLVCHSGACGSCAPNQPCTPTNKCRTGLTSCTTGVSQCVESGNQTVGTLCGAAQTCSGTTKTLAQACNSSAQCVSSTVSCPNGCTGNDCTVAKCGDGVIQSPTEQCDDSNAVTEACAYGLKSCTVCNATCQSVAGAVSYCGDTIVQSAHETCDDGNSSNLDTCSTTCTACGQLPGPSLPNLTADISDSGLQFTATANATLEQFVFHHQGLPYIITLRRLPVTDGTVIGQQTGTPSSNAAITFTVAWDLVKGTSYILTDASVDNGAFAVAPTGTFPATSAPGISVDGSWQTPVDGNSWADGSVNTSYWFTFTGLRSCLK